MAPQRDYDFVISVTSDTAPTPATPTDDNDSLSKGYADDNFSKMSSWYDKQSAVSGIKAIDSATRSNGQIVYCISNSSFYQFDSASSATGDDNLVLTPSSGTGRWLKITGGAGGSGDSLVEQYDSYVSTFLAAEDIATNKAVCVLSHNGSGSDQLKVFKADSDVANRRGFAGFSKSAVTVTQGSYTYTISAAYVSGNVVPITINGRSYSVTYASSSDNTLKLLRDAIAVDPDIFSATVTVVGGNQTGTDDRVITILTSNGINGIAGAVALNITGTTVTSGASQPTVTIANGTPPVGAAVDIHRVGPMTGFSSLTVGENYYLDTTPGSFTNTPSDPAAVFVGKALSSTVLDVSLPDMTKWVGSQVFVRTGGSTNQSNLSLGAIASSEHYNGSSWANGTSDSSTHYRNSKQNNTSYGGFHHVVDGISAGSFGLLHRLYNKSSWSASTAKGSTPVIQSGARAFNGFLYINCGDNNSGTFYDRADKWNGTAWSSGTAWGYTVHNQSVFMQGSNLHISGGYTGSHVTTHRQRNTSDTESSSTAAPASGENPCSGESPAGYGYTVGTGASANNTTSYVWDGASWSTKTTAYTMYSDAGSQGSYMSVHGFGFSNGGASNSTTSISTSQKYNDSTWSSTTSSTNAVVDGISSYL